MKNKVVVNIAGSEYTLVAVEDEAYVQRCAALVDTQMRALNNSRLSQADAAVLCAMNVADQYYQQVESETNLRAQLKEALEEAARLKLEASELKREIFKLQNKR